MSDGRRSVAPGRGFIALIVGLMAVSALAIDLMLPAFPDIRAEFGMAPDASRVGWIVTAFFLGLAIGPLIYGPLSDRFGRRPLVLAGLGIYAAGGIAAILAPSFTWIVVARVLWGAGAAGPRSLALAMVRDRYEGDAMARFMSMTMAVFLLVPIMAPLAGAGLNAIAPWRIVFWTPVLAALAMLMLAWRWLPETLSAERRRPLSARAVAAAARAVVTCRATLLFTAAITCLVGVLTTYLSGAELVVDDVYGRKSAFPFVFAGIGVMLAISSLNNARLVARLGLRTLLQRMAVGAACAGALLFVLSLVNGGKPPFLLFVVVLGLALPLGQGLAPNSNTAAMMPVPHVAGMASALIASVSTLGGSLLGNLASSAADGTARPMATGIFVYLGLAAVLILVAARDVSPRTT